MRNAKQFRDMARNVLKNRYWWAVLAALIALALGGGALPTITFDFDMNDVERLKQLGDVSSASLVVHNVFQFWIGALTGMFMAALVLAFLFVGACVELGFNRYNICQYEQAEAPGIGLLFTRFSIFWRAVGLRLLMMLKTFLWTLLFIVPGILAALRYALAPYILAENPDMPAPEAIERSKQLMEGHKARLFRLWLSFFGWYVLAALTAGIGSIFLLPYVKAAITGFYLERVGRLPLPENASCDQPDAQPQPQPAVEDTDHAEMI